MFYFLLATIASIFAGVHGGACEDKGGQCVDWRYYVCHAGVETGICPGDSNIRCCLNCDATCQDNEDQWSQSDGACAAQVGDTVTPCPGKNAVWGVCFQIDKQTNE